MLKITGVSKTFAGLEVLHNINIEVEKSTIVGLAGSSGSGKSTLLRCIQGLESVTSGKIECTGKIGFMFQDFQLFPHMNVLENITYAPKLRDKSSDHNAAAIRLLENLGVADKASKYTSELSGGQKQRVALARSLIMHPEVLLCDEPTSGLDVATTSEVIGLLESVRKLGVSMIIASHDLDLLTKISDRIILLKSGSIVSDITPRTISNPIDYLRNYYVG